MVKNVRGKFKVGDKVTYGKVGTILAINKVGGELVYLAKFEQTYMTFKEKYLSKIK